MSISTAFSNAASGLAASARAVQVISANIANAMTPGYAGRTLDVAASTLGGSGGGVRVLGMSRLVDAGLLGLSRDSGALAERNQTLAAFWSGVEDSLGLPGEGLSAALSAFDAALVRAVERPDLAPRLETLLSTATALAAEIGRNEAVIQGLRSQADAAIARDVESLNTGLARIDQLNDQIIRQRSGGHPTAALEDERDALVTSLTEIVPLREQTRADGRLVLFTAAGELLLDLEPAEFSFSPTAAISPGSTLGAGLSGLTLRGRAIDLSPDGPLGGGRLGANLELRDAVAPDAQSALDTLAADLIARFSDPGTDPTLPPGSPGLFTDDGGLAFGQPGLAGRLAVNSAVRPDAGGALWKLRDGIGAGTPGEVGESTRLAALHAALDLRSAVGPGSAQRSFAEHLGDLLTRTSTQRHAAESATTAAQGRRAELEDLRLAQGVDTDAELQRLMLIEKAYAANARVIETADAMLRRLLEI